LSEKMQELKLCEICIGLYEQSYTVLKLQIISGIKCEHCQKRAGVGRKCKITPKKGAAKNA
jgi:hypothetical protein